MRKHFALLFLSGVLLFASCGLLGSENTGPVSFQNVGDAEPLRVETAQTLVFRSEDSWKEFWDEHVSQLNASGEKVAPPAVDFEEEMLIALFWGDNGYGGCSFFAEAIERVRAESGKIVVRVGKMPDLGPCRMLVMPMQVIKVDRTEAPVEFKGRVPK